MDNLHRVEAETSSPVISTNESCLSQRMCRGLPTHGFVTCVTVLSKPQSKRSTVKLTVTSSFIAIYAGVSKGHYQDLSEFHAVCMPSISDIGIKIKINLSH